jgi:uncharacterized protein
MNYPLIKRLRANGQFYIYDAHINQIFQIDRIIYDLIPFLKNTRLALTKLKEKYNQDIILERLSFISDLQNKGYFQSPGEINLPFTKQGFKQRIGKRLKSITLNITEQCNLRCKYCVFSGKCEGFRGHSNKDINLEIAIKAINLLLKSEENELSIAFYGGEPLLKFDLIKSLIESTDKKKKEDQVIKYRMTTNGTLLFPEVVDFLVKNKIKLSVSLDGPREIHDRHRLFPDNKGSFDVIIQNLMYIKEKYLDYYSKVNFIVVIGPPYDYERLEEFFSENNGLFNGNLLTFTEIERDGNTFFDEPEQLYFNTYREANRKKEYIISLFERLKDKNFVPNLFQSAYINLIFNIFQRKIGNPELRRRARFCKPGLTKLFVDVDGKFHICENIPSSLEIGNIESGIDGGLCYEIIYQYLEVVGKNCLTCWAYILCPYCLKDFLSLSKNSFISKYAASDKCIKSKKFLTDNFEKYLQLI